MQVADPLERHQNCKSRLFIRVHMTPIMSVCNVVSCYRKLRFRDLTLNCQRLLCVKNGSLSRPGNATVLTARTAVVQFFLIFILPYTKTKKNTGTPQHSRTAHSIALALLPNAGMDPFYERRINVYMVAILTGKQDGGRMEKKEQDHHHWE